MWDALRDWFLGLGAQYGVDPLVFGAIYVGAIPFFTVCMAWTVRNLRRKRPAALPAFLTGFFFVSAYLYLLVAGRNIPAWVYAVIAGLVLFGAWSTVQKVRRQLAAPAQPNGTPGPSQDAPK
ncbi:MAG: hypothetical protein R3181_07585 [Rubricoccaceae bacterium]|nr:hypothetical protein [Rubricoccaceae bacterium]